METTLRRRGNAPFFVPSGPQQVERLIRASASFASASSGSVPLSWRA